MPNIEIKASCLDIERARGVARKIRADRVGLDHQVDTYFRTDKGRLKLREASLSGANLIPYFRPDDEGPKLSDYLLIPIREPQKLKDFFSRVLGVEATVTKDREIWIWQNVRIHLDRVEGLGDFIEFEAVFDEDHPENREIETKKVDQLMETFSIGKRLLKSGSYREMILEGAQEAASTGLTSRSSGIQSKDAQWV